LRPWNQSVADNKWLLRGAKAAPYVDVLAAGLEWDNNYNNRYAGVEDNGERVKLSTERTAVTSVAGIGTAAIVSAVGSFLLCGESAGAGCFAGVAILSGAGAVGADTWAGAMFDDSVENRVLVDVPTKCYGMPVGCLPTYEKQPA
jgi:hypothetical protein